MQTEDSRKDSLARTLLRGLHEFGYPDLEFRQVRDCVDDIEDGKEQIRHGVIGMFCKKLIEDAKGVRNAVQ